MGRWCHSLLVLLLSCSVLVTGLLPPAVLHAHSTGHASHEHGAAEHDQQVRFSAHGHTHDHGTGHSHHHSPVREGESAAVRHSHGSEGMQASARHAHVTLLGLTFSVPMPEPAESSWPLMPLDEDDGHKIIRLSKDSVTVSRVEVDTAVDVLIVWSIPPAESGTLLFAAADRRPSRTPDRICLCDSARFERSGVLLN